MPTRANHRLERGLPKAFVGDAVRLLTRPSASALGMSHCSGLSSYLLRSAARTNNP